MNHVTALILAIVAFALFVPARADNLAQPPDGGAQTLSIVSGGVQRGSLARWTEQDGVHWSRERVSVRSFGRDVDQQLTIAPDGTLQKLVARGGSTFEDSSETFAISGGRYEYKSAGDQGEGVYPTGAYYLAVGGTFDATLCFVDALRAAPGQTLRLLPSGNAHLVTLTTHRLGNGREAKSLTAYAVVGTGLAPLPVWYDGDAFFAVAADFLSYVRPGFEHALVELTRAQNAALAVRSAMIVEQIGPRLTQPVLFQDVRLYDSIARRFRERQSVLVSDGRIAEVGDSGTIRAPAGARIIPGAGRALVPGLWDSHNHFGGDESGPLLLAQGITSIRDPGNHQAEASERRKRIEDGKLLGPRIVPSLMIDGEGTGGGMAVVARNLDAALDAVRRAKTEGYFAVKLYADLKPAWIKPMAAEAHRLGLYVHGHVPNFMRPLEAVRAGYDEITHILFVMTQAMPQPIVDTKNSLTRYYGIAQYAPDVDLKGPAMRPLFDELQKRKTAVDPTVVAWEGAYVPEPGEIAPAYAPFTGTLPPLIERGLYAGGIPPTETVSRARMRQGHAALQALVGELHRRGVPIVAGTDGTGLELVRELELYVAAGMSIEDAIASATIVPAQLYGVGSLAGSITVGKQAELALVEGDPASDIGALRNVVMVMRDNRLMLADDLRRAIGITGPPRRQQR